MSDIKVEMTGDGKTRDVYIAQKIVIVNYPTDKKADAEDSNEETLEKSLAEKSPYKGLSHFGPEDSEYFFGREGTINELQKKVEEQSIVTVLGHSGSGKSSVVLAGLAPKLNETGEWIFSYFRISDSTENDPFIALAKALLALYEPELNLTLAIQRRKELADLLRTGQVLISDVLDTIKVQHPNKRVLLIADQFEELYTSTIPLNAQNSFIDRLLSSTNLGSDTNTTHSLSLIITLRTDFMGTAAIHRPFVDAINKSSYFLGAMDWKDLRQAIEVPAHRLGVQFQEGLVETILNDVGQKPGNLPLLQFCLSMLWEEQSNQIMTLENYEKVGRVSGALTCHADMIYGRLSSHEQTQLIQIFKQLVRIGSSNEETRRVATRNNFNDEHWSMVQKLANESHRLVVINSSPEQETIEMVHEALITQWKRLRFWVDEDRQFMIWRDNFRVLMGHWDSNGRKNTELLRGSPLSLAEDWLKKRSESFVDSEREFIRLSTKAVLKKNVILLLSLTTTFILLAGLALRLYDELNNSESNLKLAKESEKKILLSQSQYLTSLSRQEVKSGNTLVGALLALEALPGGTSGRMRPYYLEAEKVLYTALHTPFPFFEFDSASYSVSPDGTKIIKYSDYKAEIINVSTAQVIETLPHHGEGALFFPDGKRIILNVSSDNWTIYSTDTWSELETLKGRIIFPDLENARVLILNGALLQIYNTNTSKLTNIGYEPKKLCKATLSADGTQVAITAYNFPQESSVKIISATTGKVKATLDDNIDFEPCQARVLFSPDGMMVSLSAPRYHGGVVGEETEIYSASTGESIEAPEFKEGIRSVSFSSTQSLVITADGQAVLSSTKSWRPVLLGRENRTMDEGDPEIIEIESAYFSPDGSKIAANVSSGKVYVFSAATGKFLLALRGEDRNSFTSFNHDGSLILTLDNKGTAVVWSAETGNPLSTLKFRDELTKASFIHDSSYIITETEIDYSLNTQFWFFDAGSALDTGAVRSTSFSPDGSKIVTASFDGFVRIYDSNTGQLLKDFARIDGIDDATFSPDGSKIVTISLDDTIIVWDIDTNERLVKITEKSDVSSAFIVPGKSQLVTVSDDRARVWSIDIVTGVAEFELELEHGGGVRTASSSSDGKRVVTTSNIGTVKVWSTDTWKPGMTITKYREDESMAFFDYRDTLIIKESINGKSGVKLWNADKDELIVTLQYSGELDSVSFNNDGSRVLISSRVPLTAQVFKVDTGEALMTFDSVGGWSASFSPDGTRVLAVSQYEFAQILGPVFSTTKELIEYAKDKLPRRLTTDERQEYFISVED